MTPKVGGADLRVAPWPRPPRRLIHASHARGASQSVTIAARTKPGNIKWQTKGGSSGEKWDRTTPDMGRLGSKARRIGCGGSRRPRHQRPWTFPLANFGGLHPPKSADFWRLHFMGESAPRSIQLLCGGHRECESGSRAG